MIKLVKYKNVNLKAWDTCVKTAINKDTTALSGYLDIVYKKWDALILDNYKAVMPIPRTNCLLFKNYSTNFLTPQLGIYGNGINFNIFSDFVKSFKSNSYRINYVFNKYNFYNKSNIELNKKEAYEFDIYSKNNISINSKYYNNKHISNNDIIRFVDNNKIISNINMIDFNTDLMRQILAYTFRHGLSYSYTAYDKKNNLIGYALFIKSFTKDKLIFTAIKEKIKINEVFEFLLNNHIKVCRQNISIDLGYSDTYFDNIFNFLNVKKYTTHYINEK